MRIIRFSLAVLLACVIAPATAEPVVPLQRFDNAAWVPHESNDGDSFHLRFAGGERVVRLYFIDCPEATTGSETDARRVRTQTRYFGLSNAVQTVRFGREAAHRTASLLAAGCTVHTTFAQAPGRSTGGRTYVFVALPDGRDLAAVLVAAGLARSFGVGRTAPDGTPGDEMKARLDDMEAAAMLRRIGVWSLSDPEKLVAERRAQRDEDAALQDIMNGGDGVPDGSVIDLNHSPASELQRVRGIGEAIANRIIGGRPYASLEDVGRVRGVGDAVLDELRKAGATVTPPSSH